MMWPEFARFVLSRVAERLRPGARERLKRERQRASEWCRENAITSDAALLKLGYVDDLRRLDDVIMALAHARVQRCPYGMGGAGNIALMYTLAEALHVTTVVETGVAYGWSSLAFLLSLKNRPEGRLYSIDRPYLEFPNDRWVGVAVPEELRSRWKLYRMPDRNGIPKALDEAGCVDLVYYDSDKTYGGRKRSYPILWKALRFGGIFMSDDIGDNLAFRDFCNTIGHEPIVIEHKGKYQGVVVKG